MNLEQLEGINKNVIDILHKNKWTVDRLATTAINQLIVIPGIGLKTAQEVIRAAQVVVNVEGLKESKIVEYQFVPNEPLQRSVRVRRIYGETV